MTEAKGVANTLAGQPAANVLWATQLVILGAALTLLLVASGASFEQSTWPLLIVWPLAGVAMWSERLGMILEVVVEEDRGDGAMANLHLFLSAMFAAAYVWGIYVMTTDPGVGPFALLPALGIGALLAFEVAVVYRGAAER